VSTPHRSRVLPLAATVVGLLGLAGCPSLPCDPRQLRAGWDALATPAGTDEALDLLERTCEPTFTAAARRWVERGVAPDTTTDLGIAVHEAWGDLCPDGPPLIEATSPPLLDARRRTFEGCGADVLGVGSEEQYVHAAGSPELAALLEAWFEGRGGRDEGQLAALTGAVRGEPRVLLPPDTDLVLLGEQATDARASVDWVLTPDGLYHGAQVLMVLDEGGLPPGHRSAGKGRLRGDFAATDDPLADWALSEIRDFVATHPGDSPAMAVDARVPMATLRRVAASLVEPGGELRLVGMETLDGLPDRLGVRSVRLPAGPPPWPPVEDGGLDVRGHRPVSELVAALEADAGDRLGGAPVLAFPGSRPCLTPPEGMVCVPGAAAVVGSDGGAPRTHWPATFYIDRAPLTAADADACVVAGYCAASPGASALDSATAEVLCAFRGKRLPTDEQVQAARDAGQGGILPSLELEGPGVRCVSPGPELNTHPAPALTEIRLPPPTVEPPAEADLARFLGTPGELLEGLPICALDPRGVRRSQACRPARDYAPRAGGGPDRFLPYLKNSGGGFVGLGAWEELSRAARARSEWLWLIADDPARAALMRAVGALIAASPTPPDLLARLEPEALESTRALLDVLPADAEGPHSPVFAFEAMRGELRLAISRARGGDGEAGDADPGAELTWVADEDDYAHLHRLWSQGRARVLLVDPAGDGWSDVGRAAHELGTPVRVLDLGSITYTWGGTLPGPFRDAVAALPMDSRSVVLQRMAVAPYPAAVRRAWHFQVHGGLDYRSRMEDPTLETATDVARSSALTDDPRLTIAGIPGR